MAQEIKNNVTRQKGGQWRSRLSLLLLPFAVALAVTAFALQSVASRAPVEPEIPSQSRNDKTHVFLERADRLYTLRTDTFQILVGDVLFRKEGMYMYCDSAHFYPDNSLKAYGNVRMEQGDTLFVYADSLWYDNNTELATLYSDWDKKVRLINRDVMLETDEFYYDMAIELGYYEVGGVLTDASNRLKSLFGEYSPATKDANFYTNVELTSLRRGDTLIILTDTLNYNTDTHIALLTTFSKIINKDGVIFTTDGIYNTETDVAELFDRSMVVMKRGNTLTGDTLFYDNKLGYGEAFGNMILTDSVRQTTLMGDYGFYNELTDSMFVTGHALAMEHSRPDTLYLHGDTIRGFKVYLPEEEINDTTFLAADSTHYMIIEPKVRFYRVDLQGICDSMTFIQLDSTMYMDKHPIVWNENRQIFGNEIQVHLNDSAVDRITLPNNAFSAEVIEEGYFNQLKGREMVAFLDSGELRHLDVNGNVMAISFPMEDDSTYNKVVSMESSYLAADFRDQALERMKVWPQVKTVVTPLYLAKKAIFYLPGFQWYEALRPIDPPDVFIVPPEMVALMSQPEEQTLRGTDMKKPVKKEIPPGRRVIIRPLPFEMRDSVVFTLDSITGDTIGVDTLKIKVVLPRESKNNPLPAADALVEVLDSLGLTVPGDSIDILNGPATMNDSISVGVPDSTAVIPSDTTGVALPGDLTVPADSLPTGPEVCPETTSPPEIVDPDLSHPSVPTQPSQDFSHHHAIPINEPRERFAAVPRRQPLQFLCG